MFSSLNPLQQIRYYQKLRDEKARNPALPTSSAAVSIMLFLLHATRSLGNKVWVDLGLVTKQTGVSIDQVNSECMSLEENGLVVFSVLDGVRITDEGLYIARKLKDWLEWSEKDSHEADSHRREDEGRIPPKKKFGFWNIILSIFLVTAVLKMAAHLFRG